MICETEVLLLGRPLAEYFWQKVVSIVHGGNIIIDMLMCTSRVAKQNVTLFRGPRQNNRHFLMN